MWAQETCKSQDSCLDQDLRRSQEVDRSSRVLRKEEVGISCTCVLKFGGNTANSNESAFPGRAQHPLPVGLLPVQPLPVGPVGSVGKGAARDCSSEYCVL